MVIVFLGLALIISSCTKQTIQGKCADGVCDDTESCTSCPSDCESCLVTNGDNPTSGESHFGIGIHAESSNYNSAILEIGNVYVRLNFGMDAFGWKKVKGSDTSRAECRSCCDPAISKTCNCETGSFYYCTPDSRDNRITGEYNADTFYSYNHDILFSVWPSLYGENEPKSLEDLLSLEYPANEGTYKDYIKYLVEQYPNVKYWEVGNEADNPRFWGDTAVNYARLVTLTYNEVKRYCPDCRVGISLVKPDAPTEWFNEIIKVCDDIDFLDLHHYVNNMDKLEDAERGQLTRWKNSCPGAEIISTETGIPSAPTTFKDVTWELGTTETAQAQDIIKYFTIMFNAGYSKIYNYVVDHDDVSGMADPWESIGILDKNGRKKISFGTYQLMIEKLDYFTSIAKLADGQYKYTFSNKEPIYVLWCGTRNCSLPPEISGQVAVTDFLGKEDLLDANQITLTGSPLFVQ